MSYRCSICKNHVPHSQAMRRHQVIRASGPLKGTIRAEIPVCVFCETGLRQGVDVASLIRGLRKTAAEVTPTALRIGRPSRRL
jgi:hypothetical protein